MTTVRIKVDLSLRARCLILLMEHDVSLRVACLVSPQEPIVFKLPKNKAHVYCRPQGPTKTDNRVVGKYKQSKTELENNNIKYI